MRFRNFCSLCRFIAALRRRLVLMPRAAPAPAQPPSAGAAGAPAHAPARCRGEHCCAGTLEKAARGGKAAAGAAARAPRAMAAGGHSRSSAHTGDADARARRAHTAPAPASARSSIAKSSLARSEERAARRFHKNGLRMQQNNAEVELSGAARR